MEKNFSISEALSWGFKSFSNHFWLFLKINLVFLLAYGFLYSSAIFRAQWDVFFSPLSISASFFFAIVYYLLFLIAEEYYLFHMTRIGLALYDGKPVKWTSIFEIHNFFTFFGARWLFMIKVFLGTVLLIIPGIYIGCKYFFTGYPIIDQSTELVSDDKEIAQEVTAGVRWKILWYGIVMMLLTALTYLFLATLLLLPVLFLSHVYVYRTLLGATRAQ